MKTLSKDARSFVEGVTKYIRSDRRGSQVLPRVQSLLTKVTSAAKRERITTVSSVIPLSDSEKKGVERIVSNLVGHDIDCYFRLDPDLLGGMRIQIADWVIDTSLSSQLTGLTSLLQ